LTDEILEENRKRQAKKRRRKKKDPESTQLYQDTLTMREFGYTPREWKEITRTDRKILYYSRLMESIYLDMEQESGKRESEGEKRVQDFLNTLPPTVPRTGARG